ncbi:MAG: hypothetical protein LH614_09775 [Pyrinomonadaceae bacterium]|nr:hypothetical protein [Pyrinomonadaceae bacterium]
MLSAGKLRKAAIIKRILTIFPVDFAAGFFAGAKLIPFTVIEGALNFLLKSAYLQVFTQDRRISNYCLLPSAYWELV